jgi:hypothetical protein
MTEEEEKRFRRRVYRDVMKNLDIAQALAEM